MAKGGITKGKSHKEGGIPMEVSSTGQKVELEGGEGIINKKSMSDTTKHSFDGKKLTKCEIASEINSDNNFGVKIKCDDVIGKKYKYKSGGKITPQKAQKILDDGSIYDKPLTEKQKRYFRVMANRYDKGGKVSDKAPLSLKNYLDTEKKVGEWKNYEIENDYEFQELSLFEDKLNELEELSHEVDTRKVFDTDKYEAIDKWFEAIDELAESIYHKKYRYQKKKLEDFNKGKYGKGGSLGYGYAKKYIDDKNTYKKLGWYMMMGEGEEQTIKGEDYVFFKDGSALRYNEKMSEWEIATPKKIDKKSGKSVYAKGGTTDRWIETDANHPKKSGTFVEEAEKRNMSVSELKTKALAYPKKEDFESEEKWEKYKNTKKGKKEIALRKQAVMVDNIAFEKGGNLTPNKNVVIKYTKDGTKTFYDVSGKKYGTQKFTKGQTDFATFITMMDKYYVMRESGSPLTFRVNQNEVSILGETFEKGGNINRENVFYQMSEGDKRRISLLARRGDYTSDEKEVLMAFRGYPSTYENQASNMMVKKLWGLAYKNRDTNLPIKSVINFNAGTGNIIGLAPTMLDWIYPIQNETSWDDKTLSLYNREILKVLYTNKQNNKGFQMVGRGYGKVDVLIGITRGLEDLSNIFNVPQPPPLPSEPLWEHLKKEGLLVALVPMEDIISARLLANNVRSLLENAFPSKLGQEGSNLFLMEGIAVNKGFDDNMKASAILVIKKL